MSNEVVIIDDFIRDFPAFNKHVRSLPFKGEVNPQDGIEYPDISADIPEDVKREVIQNLEEAMGWKVQMNLLFLRNTSKGTQTAPHQAHTDTIMGTHIFLLYMQDGPAGAGTSLVRHKELGFDKDPITEEQFEAWKRDVNDYDAWEITDLIRMKKNRAACGIWSAKMHRAEPVEGFGSKSKDGRIALIGFYQQAA
jgi:hypothetical protein